MNNFINSMQNIADRYLKFLKEEDRKINMTPKEYGMMLQKKKQKKRK